MRYLRFTTSILIGFFFSGCSVVGNTDTVEGYYKTLTDEIFFLQDDVDLPIMEEDSIVSEPYDYSDPDNSETLLYDTKDYEGKVISKYFSVSDFNTAGQDTFRYVRIEDELLECMVKLHEAIGKFAITVCYLPQDYNLATSQHNKSSLRSHSSGRAVDIIPPCSVALLARKVYELCGCNIGVGVNDKWLHLELRDDVINPWEENNRRRSLYSRIAKVHSAYCVSKKITEEKSYYSQFKKKYFSDSPEEPVRTEERPAISTNKQRLIEK